MLTALPTLKILVTFDGLHGQSLAENVLVQTNDLSELHEQLADQFKIPTENIELFRSGKLVKSIEEIESGYHYRLTYDSDTIIHHFISEIQNDCPKRILYLLQSKMKSSEFALGFYKNDGFRALLDKIGELEGNSLAYALTALVKGLEIGIDLDFDKRFINKVVQVVNEDSVANVAKPATQLLILMLGNDQARDSIMLELDKFPKLVSQIMTQLLKDSDYSLQILRLNLLCLILEKTTNDLKRSIQIYDLDDLGIRNYLSMQNRKIQSRELRERTESFLGLLQKEFYRRSQMKVFRSNSLHVKAIDQILVKFQEFYKMEKLTWKDLGVQDPFLEFENVGVFGLECLYFAVKKKNKVFEEIFDSQVLSKKENTCPILCASAQIVMTLSDYWKLDPQNHSVDLCQSLFLNFEDVFILALKPYFYIWNIMKAKNDTRFGDLEKVTIVFKEHLKRSMSYLQKSNSTSLSELEIVFNTIDVETIQRDLITEFISKSQTKSSKEIYHTDCENFVRQQRIKSLKSGAWFLTSNCKSEKNIFYRLSKDELYLYFQTFSEEISEFPNIDKLHSYVLVEDITEIAYDVTDIKTKNAFTITLSGFSSENSSEIQLSFSTTKATQFIEWYEGFGLLIKKVLLSIDLSNNGGMMIETLKDLNVHMNSSSKTSVPSTMMSLELPNFDFFYNTQI